MLDFINYVKQEFPDNYAKRFVLRKQKIKENLNLINPCMKMSWSHWSRDFR